MKTTDKMIETARQAIEDEAIRRRDSMIFVMCGSGITVRKRDGGDSAIHRMSTDEAFRIGLAAIEPQLVALIAAQALCDAADALDDDAWGLEDEYQDGIEHSSAYLRKLAQDAAEKAPHV